jgi:hypothetical protein
MAKLGKLASSSMGNLAEGLGALLNWHRLHAGIPQSLG